MKIAIYPGSFDPWHFGHLDILNKSLNVFDKVIIAQGINPNKKVKELTKEDIPNNERIELISYNGLLVDYLEKRLEITAVIKGLRNSQDLEYETAQQYWNEDLGIIIPTFYIITNRNLRHVSSSAIKIIDSFNKNNE